MSQSLPSTSQRPDLDWSQVRETVMMLNLAVARIEKAMREGDESIETLSDSFTTIASNIRSIEKASSSLDESGARDTVLLNCRQATQNVHDAIVAFQFYDKLSQRLHHVSRSLGALNQLIDDPSRLYNPFEWQGLQEKILSRYTLDSDRALFDAILSGMDLQEVLEMAEQHPENRDDIELF